MHLTNEELCELDEVAKTHLRQCDACRQRASRLLEIRKHLAQTPKIPDLQASWLPVRQAFEERQQQQVIRAERRKAAFWRWSSLGLAASLMLVVLSPVFQSPSELPAEQLLNQWVTQNDRLQRQWQQQIGSDLLLQVNHRQVQLQLRLIDQQLLQAYLQNRSAREKLELWQQRKHLIEQSLLGKSAADTLSI